MSKYLSTDEDVPVFGKSAENINFSNPVQNINLKSNIANLSNDDNLSKNLADMSFELEDNTYSKNLEVDPNTNVFDEFENISQEYHELSDNISVSTDYFEDMQNNLSDVENQEYDEFPNEAYAYLIVLVTKYKLISTDYFEDMQNNLSDVENQEYDEFPNEAYAYLIVLVTKYKLSNVAKNAIISFFNKHSNNSKSPLPKNIKQGKLFMNNMKSNLSYKKTKVLDHNNTEYFLYHMLLMSCIQNILEISDISQTFALEYEELYKTTKVY
ncbi:zn-finger domain-containing protein [Gigaspora margarita]|uniref:Zn-finger domain-containing protein n=1 Tax=Gigaspora margarita TaxID=4874 RepID=A0A8H4B4B1_GIGMA|nr:zn-finger domain-containing protein [Gigaspora margarita]